MPRTLYARLALALAGLLLVVGILSAAFTLFATQRYLEEVNQRFNRDLAEHLVADRNLVKQGRIDRKALKETFEHYMVINPSIEIYLLDPAGTILAYSADPAKVKRRRVALEPIRRFLTGERELPLLGDDPRSHDRRKPFSVTPVPSPAALEGYLYVILRGEAFDSVDALIQQSYFLRLAGWAVGASLTVGLVLGLLSFRLLTRRIERLGRRMAAFRERDFGSPLPQDAPRLRREADEIDRLEQTFLGMAERIGEQFQALTDKDRLRRELVAQVSHDLRTPLASLHGYLETLRLKEGRLSHRERDEYLEIALRHSLRLRALVEDLFELAKLDAKEVRPFIEPVALGELAQDVVQKLQLSARQRGVHLALEGGRELPLVQADVALIERVLENLIDNALRYTPRCGEVRVSVDAEQARVAVRVSDTGPGIAEADRARVFDRFYQAPGKRGGQHMGLGLAIAKRILELHGSRIEVRSVLGAGASFSFALPLWSA